MDFESIKLSCGIRYSCLGQYYPLLVSVYSAIRRDSPGTRFQPLCRLGSYDHNTIVLHHQIHVPFYNNSSIIPILSGWIFIRFIPALLQLMKDHCSAREDHRYMPGLQRSNKIISTNETTRDYYLKAKGF